MNPQVVRNLKHTHKSWGCEQTHRNGIGAAAPKYLPVQVLLSLRNIPASIVEDVKRFRFCKA